MNASPNLWPEAVPAWLTTEQIMQQYVFENGYAIGYMDGTRLVRFVTPIRAECLQ